MSGCSLTLNMIFTHASQGNRKSKRICKNKNGDGFEYYPSNSGNSILTFCIYSDGMGAINALKISRFLRKSASCFNRSSYCFITDWKT